MRRGIGLIVAIWLALPLLAQANEFRVSVAPQRLQITPGPPVRFEVKVRRVGWEGPLTVTFEPPPGVTITPPDGQIDANDNDRSFAIRAAEMAAPGPQTLIVKVRPTDGGDEHVERVALTVSALPAFVIRFAEPAVTLGEGPSTIALEGESENGWTGEVNVDLSASPGLAVNPPRVVLRVPGRVDVSVVNNGAAGPGQVLATAYAGPTRKNLQLPVQVSAAPPGLPTAPAWSIARPDRLLLRPGEQDKATFVLENGESLTGRVQGMARPHPAVDVIPPMFTLSKEMPQATVRIALRPSFTPGARLPHLVFDVTTEGGGLPKQIAIDLDAEKPSPAFPPSNPTTPGTPPGFPPTEPPPFGGNPNHDTGAPLPPTPPEFTQAAAQVVRENLPVDGLAEAITRAGSVINPEQAARQVAFLQAYDLLIAELRNPMSFAALDGDALDAEIFMALAEESGVFARDAELREALYEVAALTPQLLLQSDIPLIAPNSGIPPFRPGQPADFSTVQSKVELLVMQIFLSRLSTGIQSHVTGPSRSALDALNNAIDKLEEKLGGDKSPGRVKRLLKHLMIVTAAVTVADILAKAAMAFLPNEITAFYAEINGVRRNEGDPPVTIQVGGEAALKLFIETKSPGGQIVTPSEVSGWILSAVTGSKKFDDVLDRLLGSNREGVTDEMKKQVRDEFLKKLEKVWSKLTGLPSIKQWLESMDKSFDVKPFYNKPIEVNSNRVALIESRSEQLIEIRDRGGVEKRYAIFGKHAGEQAGYHVALKKDLIERLQTASKVPLGRYAVVNVGNPQQKYEPGKPCKYVNGVMTICPDWGNNCIGVTMKTEEGIECAMPR
jgi:hypothetical protein